AAAAFWSGGSLAPPGLPLVPPPEHLLPGAVAAAVLLSAVAGEPATMGGRLQAFLKVAGAVASGTWPLTVGEDAMIFRLGKAERQDRGRSPGRPAPGRKSAPRKRPVCAFSSSPQNRLPGGAPCWF